MKVIIKINLDKYTDELIVKNRLQEWLIDNFLDGKRAEIEIQKEDIKKIKESINDNRGDNNRSNTYCSYQNSNRSIQEK